MTEGVLVAADREARRRRAVVLALGMACVAGFVADVLTGPSGLAPLRLGDAQDIFILGQVRLPVAVMAILVGAALALAGAEMQTVLDNPLASPFTLGVSSAASLGAAFAIVLGLSVPGLPANWIVAANAFVFALLSVFLLQWLNRLRGESVGSLVLFGIALVFTFNALAALLQYVASAAALQQLVFWGMGSLSQSDWGKAGLLAAVVAGTLPFSFAAAWRLTALRLGEERARSFGIDVGRLRFMALLRASLLAATAVAFVGTIGFIGLVGPHAGRLLVGEDHRYFLPASALAGALVMALASVASKTIVPGVLIPVGIVTALIGLPLFFWLILRRSA
ncbi:MAG: FecCD family ABC transporter permease [Ferrovibrionaceae bacterium]